jgi:hypothetical protein
MTERIKYPAVCPNANCRHQIVQDFDPENLKNLIDRDELRFSCINCGHTWKPNSTDASAIGKLIHT